MKTEVVLLLIQLVFAFTAITTVLTTLIIPTINVVNLAKTTVYNVIFGIQPTGDPIDGPFPC